MKISSKSLISELKIGLNDSIEFLRNTKGAKKEEEEEEGSNKSCLTFDVSTEGKKSNKTLSKINI